MSTGKNNSLESSAGRELVITRVVDAPRELVWQAMTEPRHVAQWWGPHGFTTTIEEMDFRVGGAWKHVMHGPEGASYPNHSVFEEIVKPERIVFSHGGRREDGSSVSSVATWTFDVVDERKTKVTIRMVFPSEAELERVVREFGAKEGGEQTLERLAEHLPRMAEANLLANGANTFVITRVFDAPRELVWKAWTEPERMKQWWGTQNFTLPLCEMDVRPGGLWRMVMRSPEGMEFPIRGTYIEAAPPKRLVVDMDCSGYPAAWHDLVNPNRDKSKKPALDCVQTVTMEEFQGKTTLTVRMRFESAAIRDAVVKTGMNEGWSQSLDRLAESLSHEP